MLPRKLTLMIAGALVLSGCGKEEPPANCTGHAAASDPNCAKPLYGGEILLEALVLPDLTEVTKVTTFVVESVDEVSNNFGAYSNLPTPPPSDGTTVCTRYYPDNQDRWPVQDLNVSANEKTIDVGASITFRADNGTEYVQSRNANAMDTEGRTHDFVYTYVGDGLPPQGVKFTTTFEVGGTEYTEVMKGGTYSPMNMVWENPAFNQAPNRLMIDKTQPINLSWTQTEPMSSTMGTDHFNLLAIYGAGGPPEDFHYLCLTENDTQMTIPADVVANFPPMGLFIIGNIAHFQPKGTNGRVMHQIGRFCRVQLYTLQ